MTGIKPNATSVWVIWIGNAVARLVGALLKTTRSVVLRLIAAQAKKPSRRIVLRLVIAQAVVNLQMTSAWAAEPPLIAGPVFAAPQRIAPPPQSGPEPQSVPASEPQPIPEAQPLPEAWSAHELPQTWPSAEPPEAWSVVNGSVETGVSSSTGGAEVVVHRKPRRWWQWGRRPEQEEHDPSRQASSPYHYQEVFLPPPLGTLVNAHMHTQIANGEAAMMVLYRYDFIPGTNQPNAAGMERLNKIAAMLPRTPFPVVIEPVAGNPLLSEARQQQVIALLCQLPFPFPPERVVLANAANKGLHGPDSELIYRNLEILTGSGGNLRTRFDIFKSGGRAAAAANTPSGTSGSQ